MYDAASSRGARVFLDGFDGDSAVSHGFERLAELTSRLRWGAAWREVNLLSRHHLAGIRRRRIIKEYCVKPFAPAWAFTAWNFLHHRRSKADGQNLLISPDLKRRTRVEARVRALIEPECAWSFRQDARKYHISSISQALYSYTLEIADKAAAAFQIEARYPFFDRRVLEFCVAIPPEQKLAQGWNRWILRRAMQGILPPEVQWRPSKGNLSPNFNRRLLECERDALERVVLGDSRDVEPFVDPLAMRSVFREYQRSHSRSRGEGIQLFLAVNLVRWLRANQFV
jgi:asparagine synthase (glutamine-hydrolysing)